MEGLPRHPLHRQRQRRRPRRRAGRGRVLTAGTPPRRVVLLRHGRTSHNAGGVMQGQLDVPLDGVGRAQADAVGPVLGALPPAVLLSSDLARAADTAAAIGRSAGCQMLLDARLRELHLGAWQGLTGEQARERFPDQWTAWRSGGDVARGGGETYAQAGARAAACVREGLARTPAGGTLVVVTHGGTARAALGVLLELHPGSWGRLAPLGNACWSTLVEAPWGWRLERHGASLGPPVGTPEGLAEQPHKAGPSPDDEPVR